MKIFEQPAFPEPCTAEGYQANVYRGVTKYEYFAAKAMQALIPLYHDRGDIHQLERLVAAAYAIAGKMTDNS